MTTRSATSRPFTLTDDITNKRLQFEGILLSTVHTRDEDFKSRWTELNLYHTTSGKFVLQRVGRSIRAHRLGSTCSDTALEQPRSVLRAKQARPCFDCRPWGYDGEPGLDRQPVDFRALLEVDRSRVLVSDDVAGLKANLTATKEGFDHVVRSFLSLAAVELVEKAHEAYPHLNLEEVLIETV